jgi:hypothetical protein
MDLWTALQVLARRWYVFVPLLLLTGLLGYVVTNSMAPVYEVQSSVVLLGPDSPDKGGVASNPYLNFDGSLETTAQVLASTLASDAYVKQLHDQGASGDFVVSTPGGPIVSVVADGVSGDEAVKTAKVVIAGLRSELESRQLAVGAPAKALIRAETVVPPTSASYKIGSRVRVLAALGVVGVAGSVFLTFAFESLARSRRRHREAQRGDQRGADVPAQPGPAAAHGGEVGTLASGATRRYGGP